MGRGHGHTASHHSGGRSHTSHHHTTHHHSSTHHSSGSSSGDDCSRPWTKSNYGNCLVVIGVFAGFFAFPIIILAATNDFSANRYIFSGTVPAGGQVFGEVDSSDDDVTVKGDTDDFVTYQVLPSDLKSVLDAHTMSYEGPLQYGYHRYWNISYPMAPVTVSFHVKLPKMGTVYIFSNYGYNQFVSSSSFTYLARWASQTDVQDTFTTKDYKNIIFVVRPDYSQTINVTGYNTGMRYNVTKYENVCVGNCIMPSIGKDYYLIAENKDDYSSAKIDAYTQSFDYETLKIILIFVGIDLVFLIFFIVMCCFCIRAPKTKGTPDANKVSQDGTPAGGVPMQAVAGAGPNETAPPPAAYAGAGPAYAGAGPAYAGAGPAYPGAAPAYAGAGAGPEYAAGTPQGNPDAVAVTPGALPYPGQTDVYGIPM